MAALQLFGRVVRTVVRVVQESILALLKATRWMLNRIRL
jgi:hypothetical protein